MLYLSWDNKRGSEGSFCSGDTWRDGWFLYEYMNT